jgi:GT2 family glycosyltransferase
MNLFSIVIVNFNSKDMIQSCLDSISKDSSQLSPEVIIIDNNSRDDSVPYLKKNYPQIKLIENKTNCGFGKACNQGIKLSGGKFIILLNNDCEIFSNTLTELKKAIEKYSQENRVGVIGGKILNQDGTLQYSYGKFPTLISTILDLFKPSEQRKVQVSGYDVEKKVDWVTGAFMIIKRELVEDIGYFDENYFMYYEETDLCYRAKKRDWQVIYDPAPQVIHKTPHAAKKDNIPLYIQAEIRKSHLYFFRKNRSFISFMFISIASLKLLTLKWCVYLFKDLGRRKEIEKLISVVWLTFLRLIADRNYPLSNIKTVSITQSIDV